MARIPPNPSGGDPVIHHGRPKTRRPRGHHPRHPRAKHPRAHQRPAHPHAPAAEPVTASGPWPHNQPAPGVIAALLALDPTTAPAPNPLTLTGAQHATLHAASAASDLLAAWTRQRDQSLNRVARRPGGLLRLAGL